MDNHRRKVYETARLHYVDKWSKAKISKALEISAPQVERRLRSALDEGIVQITLNAPRLMTVEGDLARKYQSLGLRKAVVIPSSKDAVFQQKNLGIAAAKYFDEYVLGHPGARIAIGAGTNVQSMIDALPRIQRNIEIFPTRLIGMGPTLPETSDVLVHISLLWDKCGRRKGMAHYATCLPYKEGQDPDNYREIHETHPKIQALFAEMHDVDCVVSSPGAMENLENDAPVLQRLQETGISREDLKTFKAVGEISYCFYDKDGKAIPKLDRFLVLGVELLKRMTVDHPKRQVILISGHRDKVPCLFAALKGGLCSVLITDEETAIALLDAKVLKPKPAR